MGNKYGKSAYSADFGAGSGFRRRQLETIETGSTVQSRQDTALHPAAFGGEASPGAVDVTPELPYRGAVLLYKMLTANG